MAPFIKKVNDHARGLADMPTFKHHAGLKAAGGYLTYERMMNDVPEWLKPFCVALDKLDPNTLKYVTGVKEQEFGG